MSQLDAFIRHAQDNGLLVVDRELDDNWESVTFACSADRTHSRAVIARSQGGEVIRLALDKGRYVTHDFVYDSEDLEFVARRFAQLICAYCDGQGQEMTTSRLWGLWRVREFVLPAEGSTAGRFRIMK